MNAQQNSIHALRYSYTNSRKNRHERCIKKTPTIKFYILVCLESQKFTSHAYKSMSMCQTHSYIVDQVFKYYAVHPERTHPLNQRLIQIFDPYALLPFFLSAPCVSFPLRWLHRLHQPPAFVTLAKDSASPNEGQIVEWITTNKRINKEDLYIQTLPDDCKWCILPTTLTHETLVDSPPPCQCK